MNTEDILSTLGGMRITKGEIGDTGIHIYLNDGRIIIIEGACIIGIYNPMEETVH